MFSATFLGHQGWLFSARRSRLLVDPLLVEEFGHRGTIGRVYPPRALDLAAFPAVDAVFITHEHEDHFNIPTLNRLDRRIPIWLSSRCSASARTILAEMGFRVRLVSSGERLRLSDLELFTFSPDHVNTDNSDEWDVLQFLVRDRAGDGSLFSSVDTQITDDIRSAVQKIAGTPGLWTHANNASDWSFLKTAGSPEPRKAFLDTMMVASEFIQEQVQLRNRWARPAGTLICGGGFQFVGKREWLNRCTFADSNRIRDALAAVDPEGLYLVPNPGQTVHMSRGKIAGMDASTKFLGTLPRARWVSREYRKRKEEIADYPPASGQRYLDDTELDELVRGLSDFAAHLYGRNDFMGLCSMNKRIGGRRPAFALVLRDDRRGNCVLEYQPQRCGFEQVKSREPTKEYVAGVSCWGSDLLAALRGEDAPTSIVFGRGQSWNFAPEQLEVKVSIFWDFFHPLRRPSQFLNLYRGILAADPEPVDRVRSNQRRALKKVRAARAAAR